jgi:hypothetical protein
MFGVEVIVGVIGMLLTLSTTIMTFSLNRLTKDVHEVRLLMQAVAKEQAADRLINEKRLGWLESEARSSHAKLEGLEARLMRHLLAVRYEGSDPGEVNDIR